LNACSSTSKLKTICVSPSPLVGRGRIIKCRPVRGHKKVGDHCASGPSVAVGPPVNLQWL